jgi:hypothetical protein
MWLLHHGSFVPPFIRWEPATTCRLTAYKQRLEEYTPSSIVKGYYTRNRATVKGLLEEKEKKEEGPFDPSSTHTQLTR